LSFLSPSTPHAKVSGGSDHVLKKKGGIEWKKRTPDPTMLRKESFEHFKFIKTVAIPFVELPQLRQSFVDARSAPVAPKINERPFARSFSAKNESTFIGWTSFNCGAACP
jgi:hypothetical protein